MPKISAVLVHDGGTNYLSGIGGDQGDAERTSKRSFAPVVGLDAEACRSPIREVAGLRGRRQRPRLVPRGGRAGLLLEPGGQGHLQPHPPHPVRHLRRRDPRVPEALVARRRPWGPTGSPTSTTCSPARALIAPGGGGGGPAAAADRGRPARRDEGREVIEGGVAEKAGHQGRRRDRQGRRQGRRQPRGVHRGAPGRRAATRRSSSSATARKSS